METDEEIQQFLLEEEDCEERTRLSTHVRRFSREWIRGILFRLSKTGRWSFDVYSQRLITRSIRLGGSRFYVNLNIDPNIEPVGFESQVIDLNIVEYNGHLVLAVRSVSGRLSVLPRSGNEVYLDATRNS